MKGPFKEAHKPPQAGKEALAENKCFSTHPQWALAYVQLQHARQDVTAPNKLLNEIGVPVPSSMLPFQNAMTPQNEQRP
jgi:hypothetical protein